ncbi:hypothetical protein [Bradyrhizobium sp. C9]|uniref:PD-(D/E)XK nuclease domain-containing protein n=1 Tax=Bradyrhizobium sp. C9 TaxID=142585 RepID=UPI000BEA757A|nr:hypothetical protein [Bradyrhizobium sp. C9]PDT76601.1 hypothetical protein CO675_13260 [Bradyrhizobium sp. C9]
MKRTVKYDLFALLTELVEREPGISELYLFGSRQYGTGSLRSDCDILLRAEPDADVKQSRLRDFALEKCPALDFFLCTEARAVSAANDSFVYAPTFKELVTRLDAVRLWTRRSGFEDFLFRRSGDWTFEAAAEVDFIHTTLPDALITNLAWQRKIEQTEAIGLPVRPFIGDTLDKAVSQIVAVVRDMIRRSEDLEPRGNAKGGWTVNLQSEYDCQNLFLTVVKPWLPTLAREESLVQFDGQEKRHDFSLFEGKLIIEMKFIDSLAKKAEVVKTLDGLARLYSRASNVQCVLMIIFVKEGVALDAAKWETDYSLRAKSPHVTTMVIRIP